MSCFCGFGTSQRIHVEVATRWLPVRGCREECEGCGGVLVVAFLGAIVGGSSWWEVHRRARVRGRELGERVCVACRSLIWSAPTVADCASIDELITDCAPGDKISESSGTMWASVTGWFVVDCVVVDPDGWAFGCEDR